MHHVLDILVKEFTSYLAWRQLHLMEISVDEFMQKAASLKGNVDALIERSNSRGGHEHELQDPPVVIPLGNIFIFAFS